MNMLYGLAGIGTAVIYYTVTVLQTLGSRYGGNCLKYGGYGLGIRGCDFIGTGYVSSGYDENMNRGLGIDIAEGEYLFVFEHLCRRDFTRDDFAE